LRIAFRVDASSHIAYGHFMRCLTLADSLNHECHQILFLCRQLPLHLQQMVIRKGYSLSVFVKASVDEKLDDLQYSHWLGVSQRYDALDSLKAMENGVWDWVIIDHYGIDHRWERMVRSKAKNILVIDDLADRQHECDALIDQNLYYNMMDRYASLVPSACHLFLGPKFAFLRPEFHILRKKIKMRSGNIKNILVYFGGVDLDNNTMVAIEALMCLREENASYEKLQIVVVIGAQHPVLEQIKSICEEQNFSFHIQTEKMAELMSRADLAIGAGGISTFERLYMRLPAILKITESNQRVPLTYMKSIGLFELFANQSELKLALKGALGRENMSPPDCVGDGNSHLVTHINRSSISIQKINQFDVRRTFKWLQRKELRDKFLLSRAPERSVHFQYWRKLINSSAERVYSIYYLDSHVGNCGLKHISGDSDACELWIYIADLSVRGKGVAKAVVLNLLEKAKFDLTKSTVYLHVSKENVVAVGLYKSAGFKIVEDLLTGPWENKDQQIQRMECAL